MTKIFKLNECDWVAANTLEEAIEWYLKETGLPEEDALEEPYEIKNPSKIMVTLDKFVDDGTENKYAALEEKYLKEGELTYKVPANELLNIEWESKPFIFCSTEY